MEPGSVFGGVAAGQDGRLYVISGCPNYDAAPTGAVRVYDPRTDAWSAAAPIPIPRSTAGAALGPDGRVYVLGGRVSRPFTRDVVEAYDPRANTWARVKPMPTPREALCAVTAGGPHGRRWVYAIGGRGALHGRVWDNLNTVEAYDPSTDTWIARAPMPLRLHASAATMGPDGKIYVMGGFGYDAPFTNALMIYDPATDAWRFGPPAPYGQECAQATFTPGRHGEVLLCSGWGDEAKVPLERAAAYNPRTETWRWLPPLPHARAAGGAAMVQDEDRHPHVYVIGGAPHETDVDEYLLRPSLR
jgi:N-acetylneuraminic acid mutarotase